MYWDIRITYILLLKTNIICFFILITNHYPFHVFTTINMIYFSDKNIHVSSYNRTPGVRKQHNHKTTV